jgi:septal ring factor EnvC (AmiA/AmiB activator)
MRTIKLFLTLVVAGSFSLRNIAIAQQSPPQPKLETLEAAVARAAQLSQRAAAVGEEAAKQRAELEALQSLLAEENQKQSAALVARGKELQGARGQVAALQKEVGELRAAAAQRESAANQQAGAKRDLEAKQAEVAALRAQVQKLEETIAGQRAEREKAQVAAAPAIQPAAVAKQETLASTAEAAPQASAAESPSSDPAVPPGTGIKKWQQPDGSLFFGERPQAGSKFLGYVRSIGTSGGGG